MEGLRFVADVCGENLALPASACKVVTAG